MHALAHAVYWIAVAFAAVSALVAAMFGFWAVRIGCARRGGELGVYDRDSISINWGFMLMFVLLSLFWASVAFGLHRIQP